MELLHLLAANTPLAVVGLAVGCILLGAMFGSIFVSRKSTLPLAVVLAIVVGVTLCTAFVRQNEFSNQLGGSSLFGFLLYSGIGVFLLAAAVKLATLTRTGAIRSNTHNFVLGGFLTGLCLSVFTDWLPEDAELYSALTRQPWSRVVTGYPQHQSRDFHIDGDNTLRIHDSLPIARVNARLKLLGKSAERPDTLVISGKHRKTIPDLNTALLENLHTIIFRNTAVSNFSELSKLPSLRNIELRRCHPFNQSREALETIAALPGLERLETEVCLFENVAKVRYANSGIKLNLWTGE